MSGGRHDKRKKSPSEKKITSVFIDAVDWRVEGRLQRVARRKEKTRGEKVTLDRTLAKNIERFGEVYCEKYLQRWVDKNIEHDWWVGLQFFFSHSFMRGRRDELSHEYCDFTLTVLEDHFASDDSRGISYNKLLRKRKFFDRDTILNFKNKNNMGRKNSLNHDRFNEEIAENNEIIKLLTSPKKPRVYIGTRPSYDKDVRLGNDEDIMMVLDVLKLITEEGKKNIYAYLKKEIIESGVEKVYEELKEIRAISDKIAAFIIRDVALLDAIGSEKGSAPREKIEGNYKYAFPIDTLIKHRLAPKLGIVSDDIDEVRKKLMDICCDDIDPLKFAAGLWHMSFNALDLFIRVAGKLNLEKIDFS